MSGSIGRYLEDDHRRIEALLAAAAADPARFDTSVYERFRAGMLRHIGLEEKILLAEVRNLQGGVPHPMARRLRIDHGAIASLLVPTPDFALVREIQSLLVEHDALEEGPNAVYESCEALIGDGAAALIERMRAVPEPRMAKHYDGPGSYRTAREALAGSARQKFR